MTIISSGRQILTCKSNSFNEVNSSAKGDPSAYAQPQQLQQRGNGHKVVSEQEKGNGKAETAPGSTSK